MSTVSELLAQGHTRMRLPMWATAYAEQWGNGPWMHIYDICNGIYIGDPVAVLIIECDQDDRWEPVVAEDDQ